MRDDEDIDPGKPLGDVVWDVVLWTTAVAIVVVVPYLFWTLLTQ
jgi:hypothetical protein